MRECSIRCSEITLQPSPLPKSYMHVDNNKSDLDIQLALFDLTIKVSAVSLVSVFSPEAKNIKER